MGEAGWHRAAERFSLEKERADLRKILGFEQQPGAVDVIFDLEKIGARGTPISLLQ